MARATFRPLLLTLFATALIATTAAAAPAAPPPPGSEPQLPARAPEPRFWGWIDGYWQEGTRPPVYGTAWRVTGLNPEDPTPNFHYPGGVAVDDNGHVFVTDLTGDQVLKFDDEGNFLNAWGNHGTADGEFDTPTGIALDDEGNVLVVDSRNNRVQVFAPGGTYLAQWGTLGNGNGEFNRPVGIAVDDSGKIYVTDTFNDRIEKFAADHGYLTQWGNGGGGEGGFARPVGVAVGSNGDVYVTDNGNRLVQRFAADGTYISQWGSRPDNWWWYYWDQPVLNAPTGIAADDQGNLFVADTYHDRIVRYDLSGDVQSLWGARGASIGRFQSPTGLAVDATEHVFVADSMNNRVQRWDPCCGLTIGGDWEFRTGHEATLVGWLGSFLPACAADRPISLTFRGEVIEQGTTDADGMYQIAFVPFDKHWAKYRAVFDGAETPDGDPCPPAESSDWWLHRAHSSDSSGAQVAQSSLRNAIAAAKTFYTDDDTYAGFDAAQAAMIEPSLNWVDATQPRNAQTVDVQFVRAQKLLMISRASSGRFYALCDYARRGTFYASSRSFGEISDITNCSDASW